MRMWLAWRLCLSMIVCLALGSCGGSSGTGASNGSAALGGVGTRAVSMKVILPAGVNESPDQTTVVTSLGEATPDSTGAVSLDIYANSTGSQLCVVDDQAGNPILMGWIDASHTTISAETTAEVLAYFALGGPAMLSTADSNLLISDIPSAAGLATLTSVIQSQLSTKLEAFSQRNTALTAALTSFASAYFTAAQSSSDARHIHASIIQPGAQSGITVQEGDIFTAYLTNNYRRRAYAFVDRVSYTQPGSNTQIPDQALSINRFDVPAVVGVTGGVSGAIADIISAYYGLQPTAWGPINAPDGGFSVPLVSGAATTTYRVTVVGPGLGAGTSASLTSDQASELLQVSLESFVADFLVPTVGNIAIGSGQRDFTAGIDEGNTQGKFLATLATNLTTDLIPYATNPASTDLSVHLESGQWKLAIIDLYAAVGGLNSFQTILAKAITDTLAASTANASAKVSWIPTAFDEVYTSANNILSAAGGVLQGFDSVAYIFDTSRSNRADQWTLLEANSIVKLNPPSNTADFAGSVMLTATVLGADNQTGFSYLWSLSSSATGGAIVQTGASSAGKASQGTPPFCASGNQVLWSYEPGETPGDVDTITVQVYSGSNCANGTGMLLGTGMATVTFTPSDPVTLSPAVAPLAPGGVQSFAVSLATPISTADGVVTYQYSVAGTAGGMLTDPATGLASTSVQTTSPSVTYTASANAVTGETDTVTVTATLSFAAGSGTQTSLGKASATITFGNPWVGNWAGSTVSTCGYYSGPQSFTITQINSTTLDFSPYYDATFSGNTASVNNGAVVFTLNGNTITGNEADSCQTGTYTRQ